MPPPKYPPPSPATIEHGRQIQNLLDESSDPLPLGTLGERLGITGERIRQICIQLDIKRPNATRGRKSTKVAQPCPTCGEDLPFRKGTAKPVIRCPACDPTHITVHCSWCKTPFELKASEYKARQRTHLGYKGNIYCTKNCLSKHQSAKKWWKASPIYQIMQKDSKKSVKQAIKDYKDTQD